MKKLLLSVVAVLATVIMCVSFAACSSKYVGTYKFKSMTTTILGVETNIEIGGEFFGVTITEDYMTLELKDDGTITMSAAGSSVQTGTWEEKDGKIALTYGNATVEATYKGGVLTFTNQVSGVSSTVELKKQ